MKLERPYDSGSKMLLGAYLCWPDALTNDEYRSVN